MSDSTTSRIMEGIIETPLAFDSDPDTGLFRMTADVQMSGPMGISWILQLQMKLTAETARQLLADLPQLEKFLVRVLAAHTTPRSVQ